MTKINYENTYIYKIVCKDLNINKSYCGSTSNFIKRKSHHKFVCNNETHKNYNLPLYVYINSNGGWDNFDMLLIEKNSFNNNLECRKREREYYELLNSQLNIRKPYLSDDEKELYYKEYTKNYNNENKDYFKEYYQNNKDKFNKKKEINHDLIHKHYTID